MNRYRIELDRSLCLGYGVCEALAPEVFELSDDVAVLRVGWSDDDAVLEAAGACPAGAILIHESAAA